VPWGKRPYGCREHFTSIRITRAIGAPCRQSGAGTGYVPTPMGINTDGSSIRAVRCRYFCNAVLVGAPSPAALPATELFMNETMAPLPADIPT
jgi:hypothetical protein